MTALLTFQNVEKSFGTRRVLTGASFAVHEGDRIGLVGVNGSGKSTMLRMLVAGEDPDPNDLPDEGLITRRRELSFAYVPQEPFLDGAKTVLATLQASAGGPEEYEIRGLSAALQLPRPDALVGRLSGGERRRVALACALLARPEMLVLDEPTNHLDARTTVWLESRLSSFPGTLILVTHDRYFLDRVATRILELDRGKLYAYDGGYTRFLEKQAERLANESARERERAAFVRRELDWIRRGPKARTTKQQARIDRFDAAVAARPTVEDRRSGPMVLRLPTGGRLGKTILELKNLSRSIGGRNLFHDLSLILKPGDRIGIVGENGAGKTTLVRTILGIDPPETGEVVVGANTRFAFLDQGRAELRDDATVLQEVAGDSENVYLDDGPVHVRTFLRMMLFDDGFADTPVGKLSGGERNRVQLAKLLRVGANLLVLDEPTNDLDLMTLGVLEEALAEFAGCAIVVSHDRWFLDRVATGILAFEGDGEVNFYEGDYSSYLARERPQKKIVAPSAPAKSEKKTGGPAPRKITFKEKQELAGIEGAIAGAEARVAELEQQLADPSFYKERAQEAPAMVAQLEQGRAEVDRLYRRWEELEALPK
jgi:ATP-binding cassette subfamily F protein uup